MTKNAFAWMGLGVTCGLVTGCAAGDATDVAEGQSAIAGPALSSASIGETTTKLGVFVNEFEPISESLVPDAIREFGDQQTDYCGKDDGEPWHAQFCPDDTSLLDFHETYAWMEELDADTVRVYGACELDVTVDLVDQKGHLFGTQNSAVHVPSDAFSIETKEGREVDLGASLDDFHYQGDIEFYARAYCVLNPNIEENADGTISADPDDWEISGWGSIERYVRGTMRIEADGVVLNAETTLNVSEANDAEIASLDSVSVSIGQMALTDFEMTDAKGLLFEAIGAGLDAATSESKSVTIDEAQDVLDAVHAAVEDAIDTIDEDIPLVSGLYEIGDVPEFNRFDDPRTSDDSATLELDELLDASVELEIDDDGENEDSLLAGVNGAFEGLLSFEANTALSSTYSVDLSTSLSRLSTQHTESSEDPELEATFAVNVESASAADSCASGLLAPLGSASLADFVSTDADVDLVTPYHAIALAGYEAGRSGLFCWSTDYPEPTTGVTFALSVTPKGRITASKGSYSNQAYAIGSLSTGPVASSTSSLGSTPRLTSRSGVMLSVPVGISASATRRVGTVLATLTIAASATLNLVVTPESDCEGNLSLLLRDLYLSGFAGTLTTSVAGRSSQVTLPDPTSVLNTSLRAAIVPETKLIKETEWVQNGCRLEQQTSYRIETNYCDQCALDLGMRLGALEFADHHLEFRDTAYATSTFSLGLDLESGESSCDEDSGGSSDECDWTSTRPDSAQDDQAFDVVHASEYEMAILAELIEQRYGPDAAQDAIREMFEMAATGPFLPRDFMTNYASRLFELMDTGLSFRVAYTAINIR